MVADMVHPPCNSTYSATQRKVALYRNVQPFELTPDANDRESVLKAAEELLLSHGLVKKDDMVVMTWGEPMGQTGGTNALKITKIGDR